uniref:BHLH domain-containing protein n=1 Tax=Callorhinchus milii TaxID=7868 RepID=A0A4W3JRW2_CALMI
MLCYVKLCFVLFQTEIAALAVGSDDAVERVIGTLQSLLAEMATVIIMRSNLSSVSNLLDDYNFSFVFLVINSSPTPEELRFDFTSLGVDIILTEPLTQEKVKCFSTQHQGENEEVTISLSCCYSFDVGQSRGSCKSLQSTNFSYVFIIRERIKACCVQLQALLPHVKGRQTDVASILEMTVEYIRYICERIPKPMVSEKIDSYKWQEYATCTYSRNVLSLNCSRKDFINSLLGI